MQTKRSHLFQFLTLAGYLAFGFSLSAAEPTYALKRTVTDGVEIQVNGQPFATYVVDQANKPYLFPIFGPGGQAMTRAYPMEQVAGEQKDHPHHRGITFGHERYGNNVDTWHEKATFEEFLKNPKQAENGKTRLLTLGGIQHREYTELKADGDRAIIGEICFHTDHAGKRMLTEERKLTFRQVGELRFIDFDQDLIASEGPVKFTDRKDAGLSIRVPTSIAVDSKQGGQIINSAGQKDKEAWGKPATWCDYHGPVAGQQVGVAMLNHPSSFRHPTRWHVRSYGLFTANPFAQRDYDSNLPDGVYELAAGERLKLRHRFVFHTGDAAAANIAAAYAAYAQEAK